MACRTSVLAANELDKAFAAVKRCTWLIAERFGKVPAPGKPGHRLIGEKRNCEMVLCRVESSV